MRLARLVETEVKTFKVHGHFSLQVGGYARHLFVPYLTLVYPKIGVCQYT